MEGPKGIPMAKAKITIEYKDVGEAGIETQIKTWVIPHKHLDALIDFLNWARKQGTLEKKRRPHGYKKAR